MSPLLLLAVAGALALGVLLFFGQEGPGPAGTRFMDALARADVEALTRESYAPGKDQNELREDWKFATRVNEHYLFRWKVTAANVQSDDSAVVKVSVERNFGPGSYEENYGLPLHKIDGKWKVDATGISREMYPALPRPGKDAPVAAAGGDPKKPKG